MHGLQTKRSTQCTAPGLQICLCKQLHWPWGYQGTHLPHSPPSCHDFTLTPPHLGKAVPRSHKNTPRKRHPALEHQTGSEPAQPGGFRADRAAENRPDLGSTAGCCKARNSPCPRSLTLGLPRNTTKKYSTVKDFKVQLLKLSAC